MVSCPIYTFKQTSYNKGMDPISYEHHYICRDIGRIFGYCNDHRDGNGCNYGVKCRREIHLKAFDDSGNIIYDIDDHLSNFRSILLSISEDIKNEIRETLFSKQDIGVDFNDAKYHSEDLSPREDVNSPSTVDDSISTNSKSSYAQIVQRNRAFSLGSSVQSSKQIEMNLSLNEWIRQWFGEKGDENISKLMNDGGIKPQCKDDLIILIKRLFWRFRIKRDYQKLDDKLIIDKFRDYQRYRDGENLYNINDVSIRSATSEKHLSQEFKSLDDDKRQEHNKNSRANSYRHNNYNMNESVVEAGHFVLTMSDIDNIGNRYLDVMAEFLDLKVFEDPHFLIPNVYLDSNDSERKPKWKSENLKFLSDDDKFNLENKISHGTFAMELFKDSNIRDEYKLIFKRINPGKFKSMPSDLFGGNWLVRLDERQFNCIIFYYANRNNKNYEGLTLRMCIRHYCGYGHDLTSLQNPRARNLHIVGVDSLLEESLPMEFNADELSRADLLNLITEYYINVSIATQIKKLNPKDFEEYKKSFINKKIPDINEEGVVNSTEDSAAPFYLQLEKKKIEAERRWYQSKMEEYYLKLVESSTDLKEILGIVFKQTLQKINEDKEQGWNIPCVTKASKGSHMITAKTVENVIRTKLGLDEGLNKTIQIDKIERSLKENQKIIKSPKSTSSEVIEAKKNFSSLSEEKSDLLKAKSFANRRDFERDITELTLKISEKSKYINRLEVQMKIEDANKARLELKQLNDQKVKITNEFEDYSKNRDIRDLYSLNETLKLSARINNPKNGFSNGSDQVSESEFSPLLFNGVRGKSMLGGNV